MKGPTIQELFDLTGKVALITGGARNLGFDMALALSEAGASVAGTSRTLESAAVSARAIAGQTGKKAAGFACDVRDEASVIKLIDAVLKEFGRLDILVNNAGNVVSTPNQAQIEDRPFHLDPVDRVWPVQHDEFLAISGAGLHGQRHRPDKGVIAASDILKIADEDVNAFQGFGGGRSPVPIEAENRHLQNGIILGMNRYLVLRGSPKTVFGSKKRRDPDHAGVKEGNGMSQTHVHRCLVAQDADARSFERL